MLDAELRERGRQSQHVHQHICFIASHSVTARNACPSHACIAGVVLGGSYGELAGRVFRIGHMGSQADLALVDRALTHLHDIISALRPS